MKKLNLQKNKFSKGVALLFAIVVSMILFTILAGVLNISLNETLFSISIKKSNDAFYIADSAIECALFNDKSEDTIFAYGSSGGTISCLGNNGISVTNNGDDFTFNIDLNQGEVGPCAKVTVSKAYDASIDPPELISTTILSRGYSMGGANCDQTGQKSTERVLQATY